MIFADLSQVSESWDQGLTHLYLEVDWGQRSIWQQDHQMQGQFCAESPEPWLPGIRELQRVK